MTIYSVKSLKLNGSVVTHGYCLNYIDAEKIKDHIQADEYYMKKWGIDRVLVFEKQEKTYKQFLEELLKEAKKDKERADKKLNDEIEHKMKTK